MKLPTKLLFTVFIHLIITQTNAQTLGGLNFDGSDNYVEIANSPLNTIDIGDFTIEAWIKGKETELIAHPMILSNRGMNPHGGGILFFFHDLWGGSQFKMLSVQLNGDNYVHVNNGSFNGDILDGKCHHIAISRNVNILSFYVDGNEIGTHTLASFSSVNFDGPLWIGKDRATNNTFEGIISQCRIWNTARTQYQINESKDLSLQGNETGLIAYWEMDNESSQTVTDKTGQFNGVLGSSDENENEDPSWSEQGCIEASVVSIDDNPENYSLQVLPNPTLGLITIEHQSTKEATLNIIDVNGKLLLTKQLNEPILNIDISDYPSGIYFLKVHHENHVISRKIIKS